MKKFKLLSAIAMAGLLGLSARAATPVPFDLVSVHLAALFQTNNSDTTSKIVKVKIVNKDILKLIASEFTNSAAAITNGSAKLAVDSFFDGVFAVLDKTNGVIVADASDNPSTNIDDYDLSIGEEGNSVDASKETDSKETDNLITPGFFEFSSGNDSISGDIFGATIVKESFTDAKDSESFKLTGTEDVDINGNDGVLTGTISGVGKDNDNIDF
jgi:hypothetical protein